MIGSGTVLTKGHGTENDFVIVPDVDGELEISAEDVATLCDRRAGIGADGMLRVVRTSKMPGYEDQAAEAEFFMDYRNADGSIAEMCGNGVRVFALYLVEHGHAEPGEFGVATRGGVKNVRLVSTGKDSAEVTVDMGVPVFPQSRGAITVDVLGTPKPAVDVDMGNPHAVVFVDSVDDAGDLFGHPRVSPEGVYTQGVNVEFVEDKAPRHLAMRVYERGVGETRSCGTGACAAMIAAARRDDAPAGTEYTVDVPGGRLRFVERADGRLEMTGPAVLLFDITPRTTPAFAEDR
jgi:diaminopimelate epimerase